MGIGDRFGFQAEAQLKALIKAKELGVDITPVWNKSFREHEIIHSSSIDTRKKADEAVNKLNWASDYFVDADHVNLNSIDLFIESCDFFTLDVADYIGQTADENLVNEFLSKNSKYFGDDKIETTIGSFSLNEEDAKIIAAKYLFAVSEAGRIYRHLTASKKGESFIVEVSMDETEEPQTPIELFLILSAISEEGIPAQTIAPKFSGRFNKGVDYQGDVNQFEKEFKEDLAIIEFAKKEFTLPENLKLSVHSGSDKFSIYGPIKNALIKFDAGVHVKTAGTTWLEELIGLAQAGGSGLQIAKKIYETAFNRYDELCAPYSTVIDIDIEKLPSPTEVNNWNSEKYTSTLKHDQSNPIYNSNFRQLLHVGYKVAAELDAKYTDALVEHRETIEKTVMENIFERHIKRLFI